MSRPSSARALYLPEAVSAWLTGVADPGDFQPGRDLRVSLDDMGAEGPAYVVSLWEDSLGTGRRREACVASAEGPTWQRAMDRLAADLADAPRAGGAS